MTAGGSHSWDFCFLSVTALPSAVVPVPPLALPPGAGRKGCSVTPGPLETTAARLLLTF